MMDDDLEPMCYCPNCHAYLDDYELAMLDEEFGYRFECGRCRTIILIPLDELRKTQVRNK